MALHSTRLFFCILFCVLNLLVFTKSLLAQNPSGTAASTSTLLFQDSFNNGVPADSDSEKGIWTVTLPQTSSAEEADGSLTLTASGTTPESEIAGLATPVDHRFNFFDHTLQIRVDVSVGGTVPPARSYRRPSRLALASAATNGLTSPSLFYVGLREAGVLIGTKSNAPNIEPEAEPDGKVARLIGTTDNLYDFTYARLGGPTLDHIDLTLDATRYRLIVTTVGKSSGRLRFSGLHGLDRAAWGTTGDSSLLLESVHNGLSPDDLNTTAVTTWKKLEVRTTTEHLLAEPYWEFKVTYPLTTDPTPLVVTVPFSVWVPATEPVIRGVIFLGAGDGDDFRYQVHDIPAQEAARALGFALIGYRSADSSNKVRRGDMALFTKNPALIKSAVQSVLDQAAEVSGHPEIKNAPFLMSGFSAGAYDATFMAALWPERTIGFVSHRGGAMFADDNSEYALPTAALTDAVKKVPGLFIVGGEDHNRATNSATVKNNFATWRGAGAQVAYAVDWGMDHTPGRNIATGKSNQGWEAGLSWLVEVANLRYPRPCMAPTGPKPTVWNLISLADDSGWLGDTASFSEAAKPSTTHVFTPIAVGKNYSGTALTASWLPNETLARMYQAFTSTDLVATRTSAPLQTPLQFVSPPQYGDAVPVNQPVSIEINPRDFVVPSTRTITQMEVYDGATLLGTLKPDSNWKFNFTPTTTGLHNLSAIATGSDGVKTSTFRSLDVVQMP